MLEHAALFRRGDVVALDLWRTAAIVGLGRGWRRELLAGGPGGGLQLSRLLLR
jgi:hypothetical protein